MYQKTLAPKLIKTPEQLRTWQRAVLVLAGTALLTLSAKISIPFWPVNATLQTVMIIALGALYGRNLATLTVSLYLMQGAWGLPVFTGTPQLGIGLPYMAGPSGGFLLGFVGAAYLSGSLVENGWAQNLKSAFATVILANLAIFIPGMLWMSYLVGSEIALTNFAFWVPSLVVKVGLATTLLLAFSRYSQRA